MNRVARQLLVRGAAARLGSTATRHLSGAAQPAGVVYVNGDYVAAADAILRVAHAMLGAHLRAARLGAVLVEVGVKALTRAGAPTAMSVCLGGHDKLSKFYPATTATISGQARLLATYE